MLSRPMFRILVLTCSLVLFTVVQTIGAEPPGVVVDRSPDPARVYIGSPSIAVLSNGHYVASHDFHGPGSTEHSVAAARVFGSTDRGRTWRRLADIDGAFWSSLFVHRERLYLLGTYKHNGPIVIRRSEDGGRTWTQPKDADSGLLAEGRYHGAPMPVVEHAGRLWRAMETKSNGSGNSGNEYFGALVLSAPVDADLLQADNWSMTDSIAFNADWPGKAWLEGNVVVTPEDRLVNILRVELPGGEKAAMLRVGDDGKTISFDPEHDFLDFPGGSNKFTIRHDARTNRYWSLVNPQTDPNVYRNVLALTSSADLRTWKVERIVFRHPDALHHAWQYVDWLFDGDDIIALSRTAWDGSYRAHDADYLTFHRIKNFRDQTRE